MYIPITELLRSTNHQSLVRSLYRDLLRSVTKLAQVNGPKSLHHMDPQVLRQCQRYEIDPKLYINHLVGELRYEIAVQMRLPFEINAYTGSILRKRLLLGAEINEAIERAVVEDPKYLVDIIKIMVDFRAENSRKQEWRLQFLSNSDDINEVRNRKKLIIKKVIANKKLKQVTRKFSSEEWKKISAQNETLVLQRYLKHLQTRNLIPNPFLLPYTDKCYRSSSSERYPPTEVVPGSVKNAVIRSAYDLDYIESIVKPSFEYDVNKIHYLGQLDEIVNEKGPFRVTISMNNSGSFLIPLLRKKKKDPEELRRIALDIKRLTRLSNLLGAWNSPAGSKSIEYGPINRDGSITVKGSRGFDYDERMFPKHYYEEFCYQEARWEFLMDNAIGKTKSSFGDYLGLWMEPLEMVAPWLIASFKQLRLKYRVDANTLEQQQIFQSQHNAHYDTQVTRYKAIVENLTENNVFKHSDIVNADRQHKTVEDQWVAPSKNPKVPTGAPLLERRGMGKTLGDYLENVGYHNFKWGKKFVSRFKKRRYRRGKLVELEPEL